MNPSIININKYHNMSLLTPAVKWAGYCWPGHTISAGPVLTHWAMGMDKTWQLPWMKMVSGFRYLKLFVKKKKHPTRLRTTRYQ